MAGNVCRSSTCHRHYEIHNCSFPAYDREPIERVFPAISLKEVELAIPNQIFGYSKEKKSKHRLFSQDLRLGQGDWTTSKKNEFETKQQSLGLSFHFKV